MLAMVWSENMMGLHHVEYLHGRSRNAKQTGCEYMGRIHLYQARVQWCDLYKQGKEHFVPNKAGYFAC